MQLFTPFWLSIIVMTMLASAVAAMPLLRHRHRFGLVCITLSLPALAVGLYLLVGTPQAALVDRESGGPTHVSKPSPATDHKPAGSVASLVDGLANKLNDKPDDGKGWLLLARSYQHLNRLEDARDAYARATKLGENDAALDELLVTSDASAHSGARISGRVTLSEAATHIILPTDTVLVFARAADGPSMPVAAIQRRASELPLDFVLDDSNAMSADATLSLFDKVTVIARVSRSGAASAALQRLEAHSDIISVADAERLTLTITHAGPR